MSAAPSTPESSPDPHLADAIARAERRRAKLERLSDIGMELAEEIRERNVHAPLHPEPRHDPCRGYAAVSRAVRLTVALEARIEADILAMRNGEWAPAAFQSTAATPAVTPVSETLPSPRRVKARAAVWEAINREIGDIETARGALDRVHERLIEGEDYDAALSLPFRECVAAICADLGLNPDWSGWSDEDGFTPPELGPRYDWPRFWSYDPERAEQRRRRLADQTAGAAHRVHPPPVVIPGGA